MSIAALAQQFVDLCNQGKNFDVMHTMYAPTIVSVESDGRETAGQPAVIQKSANWAKDITLVSEHVRGPYLNAANQFAVHFTFTFTRNATGEKVSQEEIGVYTVTGDKITREQFFNAGNW